MPHISLLVLQMSWDTSSWKISYVELQLFKSYSGKIFCPFTMMSLFRAIFLTESPDTIYRFFEAMDIEDFMTVNWITATVSFTFITYSLLMTNVQNTKKSTRSLIFTSNCTTLITFLFTILRGLSLKQCWFWQFTSPGLLCYHGF